MSRDEWYKKKLMKESMQTVKGLGVRDIRCPICNHRMLVGYEDYTDGHISSYCNKCHEYRLIELKSGQVRDHPSEIQDLDSRNIRCPVCGHNMLVGYFDAVVGHVKTYCNRCHEYRVIDFKQFRLRKRS